MQEHSPNKQTMPPNGDSESLSKETPPADTWINDLLRYELRVMHFTNRENVARALARVGHDGLENMPYWIPRADVMVVPREAVSVFRQCGLTFQEGAVVDASKSAGNGTGEPLGIAEAPQSTRRLSSEEKEWLRRESTDEEIIAELRELREKGGLQFHEFLPELEEMVERHE